MTGLAEKEATRETRVGRNNNDILEDLRLLNAKHLITHKMKVRYKISSPNAQETLSKQQVI